MRIVKRTANWVVWLTLAISIAEQRQTILRQQRTIARYAKGATDE